MKLQYKFWKDSVAMHSDPIGVCIEKLVRWHHNFNPRNHANDKTAAQPRFRSRISSLEICTLTNTCIITNSERGNFNPRSNRDWAAALSLAWTRLTLSVIDSITQTQYYYSYISLYSKPDERTPTLRMKPQPVFSRLLVQYYSRYW